MILSLRTANERRLVRTEPPQRGKRGLWGTAVGGGPFDDRVVDGGVRDEGGGRTRRGRRKECSAQPIYFSFFLSRSWFVWPQTFLRQFVARGGRRA